MPGNDNHIMSPEALLDLFSTSKSLEKRCRKNAPFICIPPDQSRPGRLYQSCCNDWNCPRCGQLRAKHEYGKMVVGARELHASGHDIYMMTVTLPGDISLADAEDKYLELTRRFHANIYYRAKSDDLSWHYAAVTERQKRGHPHTHYLTTFCPKDAYYIVDDYPKYCADVAALNTEIPPAMRYSPDSLADTDHRQLFSAWLAHAAVKAGLGVQVRLAAADLVEGASRYMATYLFKTTAFQVWPKSWKRVRYSQNWPKLPTIEASSAFPVMKAADWRHVAELPGEVECFSPTVYERALLWECMNVVCRVGNSIDNIVPSIS